MLLSLTIQQIGSVSRRFQDMSIRYNQLKKQAVIVARLWFFSITSSSLTGEEAAALILSAVNKMSCLCGQHSKRGFIAKISRGPDVKIIETEIK